MTSTPTPPVPAMREGDAEPAAECRRCIWRCQGPDYGCAEPSAPAWTLDQLVDELNFVICERRADIRRIERERKETPEMKALRISVVRDMESRVTAARDFLQAALQKARGQ